ncbi:hypothetical protein F3Y22_tig00112491pilonHSYRG00346 [Hibiscus syriacus]|uniref:Integrase catalytic domain-containing protein n=1 Tax=Hibiscus syriacus TaxID=106335 RepID=A0A6A2WYF5_HIBSY|nr:hypothetical protein F3Y22_tig00112491pilonHSYRG00346 [Hibiscus syriacus]
MRLEGTVEGALAAKLHISHNNKGKKRNGKKSADDQAYSKGEGSDKQDYLSCQHYGKKGHPPHKCWRRPDVRCNKCKLLGHIAKICKSKEKYQQSEAQVVEQKEDQLFVASCFATSIANESWLIDSGCTNHIRHDIELFKELNKAVVSQVRIGNGDFIAVKGKGTIAIESSLGTKLIQDVLYVPEINQNLLSVGQLLEIGYKVVFEDRMCSIKDSSGSDMFKVNMKGKSFSLNMMETEQAAMMSSVTTTELWHKKIGHFNHTVLLYMRRKNLARGIPPLDDHLISCKACRFGKQTRLPFSNATSRARTKLQLIHTDIGGATPELSLKGSKYYILFIDDFSRMCWIYFLKFKSEVAGVFWKFKAWVENQSGCKIQVIRSDNGKEDTSEQFNIFCEDAGIEHQLTAPYTPQQNGVSERKNRTVMEMVRCMLHEKGLSKKFWAEAANTAMFLLNRLPTKAVQGKTPFEACRDVHFVEDQQWNWEDDEVNLVPNTESFKDENIDDPLVRGTKLLSDIYERCNVGVLEPADFYIAKDDPRWISAMQEEFRMIEGNQTWELVPRPCHKKVIGRLAPVARLDTVRLLLALATQKGWKIFQLDVKSAFLNGYLQEEIYVEQPEGFEVDGEVNKVYLLKKALYGLKQAPRAWYARIDEHLLSLGFEKSPSEPTLYVKHSTVDILIVFVYVDDVLVTGNNDVLVRNFKEEMMKVFEMTDLGTMAYFLGMEVRQDHQGVFICQRKYAKEILKKFHMVNCNSVSCLMYLTTTRPDILHVVSVLARSSQAASEEHFIAAKRLLRYVKGTIDYGVLFKHGYCFTIGSRMFSWSSKKQDIVAESTAEAKFIAATAAVNQALWLRKILNDLCLEQRRSTEVFVDNQAAIAISNNPVFHGKTKHFNIKLYFLREVQKNGEVSLLYCSKNDQLADIFTKALPRSRFESLRKL